jgi:hypothetical protein
MCRMLAYKPSERATPLECLQHCFFHLDDKSCQTGHVSISPTSNLNGHTCDCGIRKTDQCPHTQKEGENETQQEKGSAPGDEAGAV